MKLKVKELMQMYNRGKGTIYTDHSTQRSFIYNDMSFTNEDSQQITRAGDVIKSILERNIQLPALYFWQVNDPQNDVVYEDNEYNIHDGKQRFLSIYNFMENNVVTKLGNVEYVFDELPNELKEKLLNYELDIVVRKGTLREEELSFKVLNSTTVSLTAYETIKGAYHGRYINEFENYINNSKLDNIDKVGRGDQAIWLLYLALGCYAKGIEGSIHRQKMWPIAKPVLELVRMQSFDATANDFDKKLKIVSDVLTIIQNHKDHKQFLACRLAEYVNHKNLDWDVLFGYYVVGMRKNNDIPSWKYETHKTAMNNLFMTPKIECDYVRFFDKHIKNALYSKSQRCGACNHAFNFDELEIDHKKPWSKGGRTDMENAQLLCKSCNSSKGDKE